MKYITCLFLTLIAFQLSAQEVGVKILEENTKEYYIFKGQNVIDEPVEITFLLSDVSGLEFDGQPIVILIQPGTTVEIAKLKKIGKSIGFAYDYNQVMIPDETKKNYDPKDFEKYNKGIVIFAKDGCTRCSYAANYLLEKNVDFTLLNFTQNPVYGEYMWDKLREQGVDTKKITTPIIMIDGKMTHSHDNLKQFVRSLTKK